jgi:hypothetical protein
MNKLFSAMSSIVRRPRNYIRQMRDNAKVRRRYQEVFGKKNPAYLDQLLSELPHRGLHNIMVDIDEGRSERRSGALGWRNEQLSA